MCDKKIANFCLIAYRDSTDHLERKLTFRREKFEFCMNLSIVLFMILSDLPPLGPDLIEEICVKVDYNWAVLAQNLEVDKNKIEKISGKTSNSADRVILTLVHWWKKVHKQPQAFQTLACALSELQLEKLAGRVLIGKISVFTTK